MRRKDKPAEDAMLLIMRGGLAVLLVVAAIGAAAADEFKAQLNGFNEIGALATPTGAILTDGTGTFALKFDKNSATYSLTYSGLTSNVTQAHIHFGKVHVAGGIFVFLCSNLGNGPVGTPACPTSDGTVTGTITGGNILAVPSQHIPAGNFEVLLSALGSNTAYANVHTVNFPAGEIRGQVKHANNED